MNFPLVAQSKSHQTDLFLVPESVTPREEDAIHVTAISQMSLLVFEEMCLGWLCCSGTESMPAMAKAPRSLQDSQLQPRPRLDHPIDLVEAQACC